MRAQKVLSMTLDVSTIQKKKCLFNWWTLFLELKTVQAGTICTIGIKLTYPHSNYEWDYKEQLDNDRLWQKGVVADITTSAMMTNAAPSCILRFQSLTHVLILKRMQFQCKNAEYDFISPWKRRSSRCRGEAWGWSSEQREPEIESSVESVRLTKKNLIHNKLCWHVAWFKSLKLWLFNKSEL